jgi:hypothetical protein
MYLRSTPRRNKDGSSVRYLQLAHNVWDPAAKRSKVQIVYSFGREDDANREALRRLAASVTRFLDPDAASAGTDEGPAFVESRPLGGTWVLDALWRRLEIDTMMRRLFKGRRLDPSTERVLFALVANRALAPSPKLAVAGWVNDDVAVDGLPATSDDACHRAMDRLAEISAKLEVEVFRQVAELLNLEMDLLFFDTISTYFPSEGTDVGRPRDGRGHVTPEGGLTGEQRKPGPRSFGSAKDRRDGLPPVVIGMAVTRTGIPVRVWSWPGATGDSALIREAEDDMRDWSSSKIVWVADRGLGSMPDRRHLRTGDHHYIVGEKLRPGSAEANEALARPGRYRKACDDLKVKEVRIREDERFIICLNPETADRDAETRRRHAAHLADLIDDTDALNPTKRAEIRGVISAEPGLNRYLRTTPGGLLRVDAGKIKAEENLDGKYLLRTSDPEMSTEDIALGHKQLLEVERGRRGVEQALDPWPVFHHAEERVRAHVLLCWLALLLVRIAETGTGQSWPTLRDELDRIKIGTFTGPAGTFQQRTEITEPQRDILHALKLDAPPRIRRLTTAGS